MTSVLQQHISVIGAIAAGVSTGQFDFLEIETRERDYKVEILLHKVLLYIFLLFSRQLVKWTVKKQVAVGRFYC